MRATSRSRNELGGGLYREVRLTPDSASGAVLGGAGAEADSDLCLVAGFTPALTATVWVANGQATETTGPGSPEPVVSSVPHWQLALLDPSSPVDLLVLLVSAGHGRWAGS